PSAGEYSLDAQFVAKDSGGTDVHVLENGSSIFDDTVYPGHQASLKRTLSLATGDTIDFAVGDGPDGNFYFDTTGINTTITSLTLRGGQVGPITLSVSDGRGGTATQTYTVDVQQQPGNEPPVITSNPATAALAGQAYSYSVRAVDSDNDSLTYSLPTAP